jgi:hypothetical protein
MKNSKERLQENVYFKWCVQISNLVTASVYMISSIITEENIKRNSLNYKTFHSKQKSK